MSDTFDLKKILLESIDKLHHAYCLEGSRENILNTLFKFLEDDLKFKIKGNPDFYSVSFDTLGIDEGRSINEIQSRKAVSATRRIFIISANFITKEAQNSLLKMFEEPSGDSVFFLIISSASILLPTLRSRMMIVRLDHAEISNSFAGGTLFDAGKFIKSSVTERLAMVKKIVDKIVDEETSRFVAVEFLNAFERELLNDSLSIEEKTKNLFVFKEIDKCRSYANDRSPSVKMLLEHIALML